MPGQRTPGRRRQRLPLRVRRCAGRIDLDREHFTEEINVADPEGFGCRVAAHNPQSRKLAAYRRGRTIERWIVMRLAAVAANAPAICKDVRVEQVGSCHLRSIVECGSEQTIAQLCPSEFVSPNRL